MIARQNTRFGYIGIGMDNIVDNQIGYEFRIYKDTYNDIYGYPKVILFGYN